MAATVIAVGKQMGITRRGIEIGISVATEQSSLRPEAVNKDWLGLFQQNPVTYTQYRRTEPGGASWMFYDQLVKQVPGYDTDTRPNYEIGDVVQKTTTGERFAEYQDMATALADQLLDKVSLQQDDVTCAPAPAEQATTGTAFDPGNIISDAVFYNTASMTVEQIREFLRSEGEGCVGSYCLKNLTLTTPDQPADRYCAAYQGGTNEDAATVISKFSTACGISPQVMLVTLQKESGLLSRTDTSAGTYNAAWGWHCPDTGPGGSANCDPAYAGFFNQGYGMAKQWSRYRLDPDKYNYRAGQTVDILWNVVESGCGSAPVTIQNTATASLYIYTPYQPNAASLAAYPGTGDACSAYGNRNFFYMFRKYFGSTGGGASTTSTSVLSTGTTVKIPDNQYVSAALSGQTITAPNAAVAAGLAAGFTALGMPYVWGGGGSGAGPNNGCTRGGGDFNSCGSAIGFDCSGLTAYVLGMAGYQTPGDSGSQRSSGTSISWAEALPGDIVGFPGHVAIYLGTFGGIPYILEASWVGTPIHIVPLTRTDVDDRVHRYWTGPAVRAPGVADFGAVVRGYTPLMTGNSGTSIYSGWTGARSSSGSTPQRIYSSTIPRLQPRPWPAPVTQTPPAPVVQAPVETPTVTTVAPAPKPTTPKPTPTKTTPPPKPTPTPPTKTTTTQTSPKSASPTTTPTSASPTTTTASPTVTPPSSVPP
ncbi:MAG TPA: NlpC/P60 family protein, partial [Mycobacterium sp.]